MTKLRNRDRSEHTKRQSKIIFFGRCSYLGWSAATLGEEWRLLRQIGLQDSRESASLHFDDDAVEFLDLDQRIFQYFLAEQ